MKTQFRVILFLDSSRGFGRGILKGFAKYSSLYGPWTFYRKPPEYLSKDQCLDLDELRAWEPDGVVCSFSQVSTLSSLDVPMIVYDADNYEGTIPCILSDDEEVGVFAAQHLINQGHRSFSFCGFDDKRWSEKRRISFCNTIRNAGFEVSVFRQQKGKESWAMEESLIREWILSMHQPMGLFCANDDRATTVMEVCRSLSLTIPEEIAIIGADDDEHICDLANPPLSSVQIASDYAAFRAAALLSKLMNGEESSNGQRLYAAATGVNTRQSSDELMIDNKLIRKVFHYIRKNIKKPMSVEDVVRISGCSHRSLNEHFNRELGTSISKQITRMKIDYSCRLLVESDLPIQLVSHAIGYEDERHFSRYFKRSMGMSPTAYRRDHTKL